MSKKYNILQVKDESDKLVVNKGLLWDVPFRLLLCGSSGSGKTSMLVNLVANPAFYLKDFKGENIYIISGSLKNDQKVKRLAKFKEIPDANLFGKFDENRTQILYDWIKDEFHKEMEDPEKKVENRLIILDDVSYSGDLRNKHHGVISEMMCNSRKLSISLIICCQKYTQASLTVRTNLTGAIFWNTSQKQLEAITDDLNYNENKKKFIEAFRVATKKKYGTFIINFSNDRDKWYMDSDFKPIDL